MKENGRIKWIIGICILVAVNIFIGIILLGAFGEGSQTLASYSDKDNIVAYMEDVVIVASSHEEIDAEDIQIEKVVSNIELEEGRLVSYDFTIGDKIEFDFLLTLQLAYDDSGLEDYEKIEDCIVAGYYNEESESLEPVIYEIDKENKVIIVSTNHLTEFTLVVCNSKEIRDKNFDLALTAGAKKRIIPESTDTKYKEALKSIENADLTDIQAADIVFTSMNNSFNKYSNLYGLTDAFDIQNKWMQDISEEFSKTGLAMITGQVIIDLYKGDIEKTNENLMKNLASYAVGSFNSAWGFSTYFIDYSLNELATTLMGEKEKLYLKNYKDFYDYYEDEQDESFLVRMYKDMYQMLKEQKKEGQTSIVDTEKKIKGLVMDYCSLIWTNDKGRLDWEEFFDKAAYDNLLTDDRMKKLSTAYYKELMEAEMQPVIARVQKQIRYDMEVEALTKLQTLEKKMKKIYSFDVYEADNKNTGDFHFANMYIRFNDVREDLVDQWTFQLDDQGHYSMTFTGADYMMAYAPSSFSLYENYEDIAAGRSLDTYPCHLDEVKSTFTAILGADFEYDVQASYDLNGKDVQAGQTVWFKVNHEKSGYKYVWNVSNDKSAYIETSFGDAGTYTVLVDVYDDLDTLIASLSKGVIVSEFGEITLISNKDSGNVNEDFSFEVNYKGSLLPANYIVLWDFGDGMIDQGPYPLYDFYYETSGVKTIKVDVLNIDGKGNHSIIAHSETRVTVVEEEELALIEDNSEDNIEDDKVEHPELIDEAEPIEYKILGTFSDPFEHGDGAWYYEFYDDGSYTHYSISSGERSKGIEGTYKVNVSSKGDVVSIRVSHITGYVLFASKFSDTSITEFYEDSNVYSQ